MSIQRWSTCACFCESIQHAVAGNRLLSRWDVQRLPSAGAPVVSWRCHHHRRCKMRVASVVWANEQGDLCCVLACGHQTQWVFQGEWGSTPALVERGVDTGQIKLDRRQRCYACGDQESEAHTTRHAFAHSMKAVGAKVSDIQARLGHSSPQTTGTYLAALKSAYNPQAEALADLFGAEEE